MSTTLMSQAPAHDTRTAQAEAFRAPLPVSLAVAGGLILVMALIRLWLWPDRHIPIGYGVPLAAFLLLNRPGLLWATAGAFVLMSLYKHLGMAGPTPPGVLPPWRGSRW